MASSPDMPDRPVSPQQRDAYTSIIDQIVAASDLNTVSVNQIREGLQERVDHDLAPQKSLITKLIKARFFELTQGGDESPAPAAPAAAPTPAAPAVRSQPATNGATSNGHRNLALPAKPAYVGFHKRKSSEAEEDGLSSAVDEPAPKKVKKAAVKPEIESDEVMAARLQAELNQTARATRGGGVTKRKAPAKKDKVTKKKKSSAKVKAEDDSDLDSADGEKPEKEKKGGFHKPMALSEPLAALLGESVLSRPQCVKKIWQYVKERDLQDPADKRQIRCDDRMRAVFKSDRVHMFTMNKVLATQLYPYEEEEDDATAAAAAATAAVNGAHMPPPQEGGGYGVEV